MFMCRHCWSRVPTDLRRAVWATWELLRTDFGNVDALHAYEDARSAALRSLGAPEERGPR